MKELSLVALSLTRRLSQQQFECRSAIVAQPLSSRPRSVLCLTISVGDATLVARSTAISGRSAADAYSTCVGLGEFEFPSALTTYLIGEKNLNPDDYATGFDWGDDHSLFVGNEVDVHRWTIAPPMRDRRGVSEYMRFGSAHTSGFQVALCDGSVRHIAYEIDATLHRNLGNRADGQVAIVPD